ncbi:MAG: Asp-tRNA(Asn)/Glu-tRNA(Gln) amidotransferase subunit GatB [Chloroflexi bacterium]|nr:Asp-tRNA(Asn)/Glu-tRNA(Gln) amidotransferase subunit GatB [Chloroflexota bacterium]MCY3581292.1 Asp-tRNA(Asn)/Glu-tRNA(Gln) amidotransferase subunit GatB [Chloroflexota bacterium]MCY3716718.1 Asp-tRNA(Asn)/Glu-tRNA(Gln) amidotransferase subunit GatB [Chloroflexota bacterium]MDE2649334.1 Asp-tRNA(Asn)/Glu-tRNA(Gln) amidotransferase subunit GatB [Chloroflexota bacterium]MXV92344.1 Asp-tRNA(Asn)/Glu-tRNA(Gln) amidotransferase subunit GatB [Chloroflexota bacterium]
MGEWTTVIGLEVHAEMETASKMFSRCPVVDSVEAAPNSAVDALSLGMPGTLPIINQQAMEYGIMVGLALNCEIPPINQFARKNYFYPDLPKGYQISQYDRPLAINGHITIELDGAPKRIRVRRAHMEEDTGKLTHSLAGSLVDYNRAGVPLLEIVSEPDLRSAAEAEAYARKLRSILRYLGVNSGDMSKGVLRFEANVSVMRADDTELRERTEIKNLNSIRNMVKAIDYEVARQIRLYRRGETVKPATLGWDEAAQAIQVQRYKERADEYRYFPEPDLPVVEVSRYWVAQIQSQLPALPDELNARFVNELGLSAYDAGVLTAEPAVARYFMDVVAAGIDAKLAANWLSSEIFRLMNAAEIARAAIQSIPLTAQRFAGLLTLLQAGAINQSTARKQVLPAMWSSGRDAQAIVNESGLAQVSDAEVIGDIVDKALIENDAMVARYLAGNDKVINALFGRIMGALRGKGDPAVVRRVLNEKLAELT